MTFFSLGVHHHDFALMAVGEHAPLADSDATGRTASRSRSVTHWMSSNPSCATSRPRE